MSFWDRLQTDIRWGFNLLRYPLLERSSLLKTNCYVIPQRMRGVVYVNSLHVLLSAVLRHLVVLMKRLSLTMDSNVSSPLYCSYNTFIIDIVSFKFRFAAIVQSEQAWNSSGAKQCVLSPEHMMQTWTMKWPKVRLIKAVFLIVFFGIERECKIW